MLLRSSRRLHMMAALLAVFTLVGCSSEPGNVAGPANTATTPVTNSPTTVPGGMPGNMPQPLGMEDSIEGRVVGVLCLAQNAAMPAAEAKSCAEASMKEGGALAVLGNDGVLYVNDEFSDVRKNNKQFEFFIGEEVTVQGQLIGDSKKGKVGNFTVKEFKMKLVRRKAMSGTKPGASNKAVGK